MHHLENTKFPSLCAFKCHEKNLTQGNMCDTLQKSQFYTELATGTHRGSGKNYLYTGRQSDACCSAVLQDTFGLFLCFEVVRPGEGLRRGEKESSFNTPVRR